MRLGDVIEFRKDLYFEGAVQADWFYDVQKAAKVAENFVFHGKNYFGVEAKKDSIDTISLVEALAKKLGKDSENPRSLAIADYGTGKSHLAVTLAVLLSGPQFMPKTYKKVLENIRVIDEEAALNISTLCKDRNFVIMLNGIRDFNLHSEILKATQKSLKLYGVDDSDLKKLNRTVDTAIRFFELNAKSHLSDFEQAAADRGWRETGDSLIERINETIVSDDDAFEIVNKVYEQITGQFIRWEEGISAKSILEMLLSKYCGLNGQFDNIVILFDEFGRFLEYASGTDGGKCGDNALQEIFEVSQNAAGALQVINFIQTDIKTYLLRVDQSRNLSRYIGRYDESEKFHISSNLETVFANLISRKDKAAFVDKIVSWQGEQEEYWEDLFEKVNKWVRTSGIWADYNKFRKVIVEGIYPMHPISVFMLTQLSDYFQNRSSMNLISQYISSISDADIDAEIPLINPVELMSGDLFIEMLSAETSGRHRSDYCIRYENVFKKNSQKLNANQIKVLRANLVTRTLRFNTRTYEEAKDSLMLCSGLTEPELNDALAILVDEYAVMAFDEMSGCFDFTEDAKGAYDYKIMKRRLLSKHNANIRALLKTANILEWGGLAQNQPTNFGTIHKILTNEWCFTQEVILAEDLTLETAKKYRTNWEKTHSVVAPKGKLIWVYVNKDTDYHELEKLNEIADSFTGTPIIMMLLNDSNNMLKNILTEYDVLDHLDEMTRNAYNVAYLKDHEKVVENLTNIFESLKKRREQVTKTGIVKWRKRLPIALTDIFEELYPDAVSYNFDGLLTSANNFTGNGAKYYCQIMKMLLSNKVNFDTIHDFSRDVRNRIEALFMVDNASSWKCLTKECAIVSPLNEKAKKIYNIVEEELEREGHYDSRNFFEVFCAPPYGLSEEAAAMFLSILIVNLWHNIRVEYNGKRITVNEWKDEVIEEKKLHLEVYKATTILWVDTGSVETKFQQLYKKIDDNHDLERAKQFEEERKELIEFYGLPESQSVYDKLAVIRFSAFHEAEKTWNTRIGDIEEAINKALERCDIYGALTALEMISEVSLKDIFEKRNIDVTEEFQGKLKKLCIQAEDIIKTNFEVWLDRSVYCKAVDQMSTFEKFCNRCSALLATYGYYEYSALLDIKCKKELAKKDDIRSRQELISDGKKYLNDAKYVAKTNYIEIIELVKRGEELKKRFKKFGAGLGKEALSLSRNVEFTLEKLDKRKKQMQENLSAVYDNVADAESVEGLEIAVKRLREVLEYSIPEKDRVEYENLQKLLNEVMADNDSIRAAADDRRAFERLAEEMENKYSSEEYDYDFTLVISDSIKIARREMDENDKKWRNRYATLGSKTRQEIHSWKRRLDDLPAYLSDETNAAIKALDAEADKLISDGKIEDVIIYFKRLDNDEKGRCLEVLKKDYLNS